MTHRAAGCPDIDDDDDDDGDDTINRMEVAWHINNSGGISYIVRRSRKWCMIYTHVCT